MQLTRSLKFRLSIGIIAVMLPLVLFTFYNNTNAVNIVEEKVTETYSNTLRTFVERVDEQLREVNQYLFKMETQDSDIGVIQSYPYLSDEYILTKVRMKQKLMRDTGFYTLMDTIFVYSPHDLIHASDLTDLTSEDIIHINIAKLIKLHENQSIHEWHLLYDERVPGGYFLARIHQLSPDIYGGAFVSIADIVEPLDRLWNSANIGETMIYSHDGKRVLEPLTPRTHPWIEDQITISTQVSTHTAEHPDTGERYLVMSLGSKMEEIVYSFIIPESTMLRNIPFLQKATYFIPLGIAVMMLFFLLYLNEIVLKPISELMRGMRKISMGALDTRVKETDTTEFYFLANSFNTMAQEVKNLKIDVYEEQLRVQQAEFKHLQAQISPHFYMNSLNIIYNFAALGDNEAVKKMSLHLADYFRFIMHTNRNLISLSEEIRHIENYIEIQKIRFPDKLVFQTDVEPELNRFEVPALTLQPFIENAIIHGFKNRKQTFRITLEVKRLEEKDEVQIRISDNGLGFTPDVLQALAEDKPLQEAASSRVGIRNVIHRLKLHYQHHAQIDFSNGEEGGALITIRFPYAREQQTERLEEGKQEA